MRPSPVTDESAPLTAWFWALDGGWQRALVLVAVGIGILVIQAVRKRRSSRR